MRVMVAFPGHVYSTYDLAEGHTAGLAANGVTVERFDYHTRLSFYDRALAHWQEINPRFDYDASAVSAMASEALIMQCLDFIPDVVLIVAGLALHRRAFDLLARLRIPAVLLTTEAPYSDAAHETIIKKGQISGTLANDRASVSRLPGRAAYLPQSYNPYQHKPRQVNGQHTGEVFFFGTLWPERRAILDALPAGDGWHIGGIDPTSDDPAIMDNLDLAKSYSGHKISINHHRTISGDGRHHTINAYSLGPRPYEIAACGGFMVSDYRPELAAVFGSHAPTYSDGDDLREKIRYYLDHDNERERLAAAQLEAVQGCSYPDRSREIVIPFLESVIKEHKNGK